MSTNEDTPFRILVLATPYFNLAATAGFLDPFRAANYLTGRARFRWDILSSDGGPLTTSNGARIETTPLATHLDDRPQLVLVSSSWTPENHHSRAITMALHSWLRQGAQLAAVDTGAFILARSGLLSGRAATVHYEHLDALSELFPDIRPSEDLITVDGNIMTCCGGLAAADMALMVLGKELGENLANAAARYLFHPHVRGPGISQNPPGPEPFGRTTPRIVRDAIALMESHLEVTLTIPAICARLDISQRQLGRLFRQHVHKSPVQYYRDIRLDRARGLVTQTEMKMSEIAVASGFASQVHFSRAYSTRFGLPPLRDRTEGRVPFEFRAWPMHDPATARR